MPIGDLLAQISGGKASSSSTPALQRANSVPSKRKPDDDLARDVSKTARISQTSGSGLSKPAVPTERYMGNARPGNTSGSKPVYSTHKSASPAPSGRGTPMPAAAPARGPPKKGSFAEVLARAQRAQAVMGQVGKIQHKKVDKGTAKKAQDESPAPTASKGRAVAGGYTGTAKPSQRTSQNGNSKTSTKNPRQGFGARPIAVGRSKAKAAEEEEAAKKIKKAAQATTGYTGTARPKPGNPVRKKDVPRGGALLHVPRHTSSKVSRYEDDYDEELDDFIEYDDEEDDAGGPRYDYASDGSSDMEAGMDQLDQEERRAAIIARREDEEEERLEKSLKAAKEDKKRKALESLRARRR
ncbi:hypothetical protein QQS21_010074 [Conoideocrella luteorostrata]|uniref:SPT2 chromatin protein n=1 Tax=Conoideocrella luteorostrata TaxID=1105319 RepID=A0AAJ0CIF2_9HYPO|nr:hypothetical protein QQS21_010074 [Conoideocrella luteorostrata]